MFLGMIKQRYLPKIGENRCEMNARGPNREVRGPKTGCKHRKWHSATKWVPGTPVSLGMIKQRHLPKTGGIGDGWAVPNRGTRPDGSENREPGSEMGKMAYGHEK